MLYRFDELHPPRQEALHAFIAAFSNPASPETFEETSRLYGGNAFTQGRTHWSQWVDGRPVATLGAVTEAREAKGEVYLTGIHADAGHFHQLENLLQTALEALAPWYPCRLKLGANAFVPGLPQWAEDHGFSLEYRLTEMVHEKESDPPVPSMTWHNVASGNAEDYRKVHNAAFVLSPNGAIKDQESMQDVLEKYERRPGWLQLGEKNGKPAVALALDLKPGPKGMDGIIASLGVHPAFQGHGLGREGLRRGMGILKNLRADRVVLAVIDSNLPAVTLYRSEGFAPTRILSSILSRDMKEARHERQ